MAQIQGQRPSYYSDEFLSQSWNPAQTLPGQLPRYGDIIQRYALTPTCRVQSLYRYRRSREPTVRKPQVMTVGLQAR